MILLEAVDGCVIEPIIAPHSIHGKEAFSRMIGQRLRQLTQDRSHTVIVCNALRSAQSGDTLRTRAIGQQLCQHIAARLGLSSQFAIQPSQGSSESARPVVSGPTFGPTSSPEPAVWEVRIEYARAEHTVFCPSSWIGSHLWIVSPCVYQRLNDQRLNGSRDLSWLGPFQSALHAWAQEHVVRRSSDELSDKLSDKLGERVESESAGARFGRRPLGRWDNQSGLGIHAISSIFASLSIVLEAEDWLALDEWSKPSKLSRRSLVVAKGHCRRLFALAWRPGCFPDDGLEGAERWLAGWLGLKRTAGSQVIGEISRTRVSSAAEGHGFSNCALRSGLWQRVWTMRESRPIRSQSPGFSRIDDRGRPSDRGQPQRIGISKAR